MTKNTPHSLLLPLRTDLENLQRAQLPQELASAVQDSLKQLDKISDQLSTSDEQRRLAALYRVSQALGASLDLDEVLNQVMDAVISLVGAERGFLVLLDPETGAFTPVALHLRAARNFSGEDLDRSALEVSTSVIQKVVETGISVVTSNAQADPRFAGQDSVVLYGLRSILCSPLKAGGKKIGVIYVENRAHAGIFGQDEMELLNTFAAQAAIAIENARLYTRTDQALSVHVTELETLTRIDQELNAQLDLERALEITRRWAVEGTRAAGSWVVLLKDDKLVWKPGGGTKAEDCPLPAGDTLEAAVRQALADCTPLALVPSGGRPARLLAPVIHSSRPLGVLVVERPDPFPDPALTFLNRLSVRAANAIANARLYLAVQEANSEKTKFISVVTHELRIPMTSIKGYTDLLRVGAVGPVNEQQVNFLTVIRNNVERMSTLVSDLSDISHIESGRMRLNPNYLALPTYIDEAINTLKQKLEEKGQTITLEIPADLPHVYADPNRVVQVLTNLISNAWKYTPQGGAVQLRGFTQQDFVRIEVTDNGIGISEADQANLFSQFFRSEDAEVREQQGWGLGLSIAKKLVDLMGGEVGAQSVYRKGSTFWFTLPTVSKE